MKNRYEETYEITNCSEADKKTLDTLHKMGSCDYENIFLDGGVGTAKVTEATINSNNERDFKRLRGIMEGLEGGVSSLDEFNNISTAA